jgi:ABC-type dipeptide/oligopeptide/nickel transport system permease component
MIGLALIQLPTLPVAAMLMVAAYQGLGLDVIFPVHLLSQPGDLVWRAILPAGLLLLASGFYQTFFKTFVEESRFWAGQPFLKTLEACGIPGHGQVQRVVLWRSLSLAWAQALPWLFAELMIVEKLFNAPGLGLDLWTQATRRDFSGLSVTLTYLIALFMLAHLSQRRLNRWLGEKLAGYV